MRPTLTILLILTIFSTPAISTTRDGVSLEIYNRDLTMVRDLRTVAIEKGESTVEFTGISGSIFGHTAAIRPSSKGIETINLTYNYDLLNHDKLVNRFLGQWFSFATKEDEYSGRLLAIDDKNIFLQPDTTDDLVQVVLKSKLEEMFYPRIPEGLYLTPTLSWNIKSSAKQQVEKVEITYLTTGITWMADYRAEIIDGKNLLVSATATIANDLDESFGPATVSLLIAKPHKSDDPEGTSGGDEVAFGSDGKQSNGSTKAPGVGTLHRATLSRKVTLRNHQTIQVPYLPEKQVPYERRFFFPHLLDDQTVAEEIRFDAASLAGNSTPLPEGDFGLYRRTNRDELTFVGEDFVPITPAGGKVNLTVGQAVDLSAKRTRMSQLRPTRESSEETWQIEVVNGRDEEVVVWAEQRVFGYYKLTKCEVAGVPVEPDTGESGRLLFPIKAPAQSTVKLVFTLGYGF